MLNRSAIVNLINTDLPDNATNSITAEDVRDVLLELNNSSLNLLTDANQLGLHGWSEDKIYTIGQCAVVDNEIYQVVTSTTTLGSFVPAQWKQISTYIASTSGFSDYIKKSEGIELDPNKYIKTIATDTTFTSYSTGFYKVEAVSTPVGLNEQYPVSGKALVAIFKRSAEAESLIYYYPLNDIATYYVRKPNTDWIKSGASQYNFTGGIENVSGDIKQGGEFTTIDLDGIEYNLSANNLNLAGVFANLKGIAGVSIDSDSNINIHADSSMYISANAPIQIDSSANINLTANAPIYLRSTAGPLYLTADNAPVFFDTPYALRYSNTHSDLVLNDPTNSLYIPHIKWIKDYVSSVAFGTSGCGGGASYTFGNGIVNNSDTIELGGNYSHISNRDGDYDSATSLDPYQYNIINCQYDESGLLNSSQYSFTSYGAYFANKDSARLRVENTQLEFTDTNTTYRFQNNNLYMYTNNGGSNSMQMAMNPNSGFSIDAETASTDVTFDAYPSQLYYSASYYGATAQMQATPYQFNYSGNNGSGNQTQLQAQSNFYYSYYDGTYTTSLNVGSNSINYSSGSSDNYFEVGSSAFQVRCGGIDVINGRNLHDNSGNQVMNWDNGFVKKNYTVVSSDYSVTPFDYFIEITDVNDIVITLQSASYLNAGQELIFKHNDRGTHTTTITAQSGELIDDSNTLVLASAYTNIKLICNGSKWLIVSI